MKNFTIAILLLFITASISNGSFVGSRLPVGTHIEFNGSSCPVGYIPEDGSSLLRTGTYAVLFSVLGSTWGSVDGTHFNVPDRRGVSSRGDTTGMGGTLSAIGSNNATVTAHGFKHSGIPLQLTGTTPTGLSTSTTYWDIFIDANTIAFAASQSDAMSGIKISISGTTGAAVVQWQDPDSASRFATSTGGVSSGIGSSEADQFVSHTHGILGSVGGGAAGLTGGGAQAVAGMGGAGNTGFGPGWIGYSGGNETRAKNVYVLNCIQF